MLKALFVMGGARDSRAVPGDPAGQTGQCG